VEIGGRKEESVKRVVNKVSTPIPALYLVPPLSLHYVHF
jgi:hypothetical protein